MSIYTNLNKDSKRKVPQTEKLTQDLNEESQDTVLELGEDFNDLHDNPTSKDTQ